MVNTSKTRVATQSSCQTVTGVVVNKILGLSRQQRRRLRAMAHRLYVQPATGTVPVEEIARFRGHLAYLSMLNPEQAGKLKGLA